MKLDNKPDAKRVLLLRADLSRYLGLDVRNARLNAITPVAWLKTGDGLSPLYAVEDLEAARPDASADFKALQESYGFDRVALSNRLEKKHGKDWQAKLKNQASPLNPTADYAMLQETRGLERVALSRQLEDKHGKNWQRKFRKTPTAPPLPTKLPAK